MNKEFTKKTKEEKNNIIFGLIFCSLFFWAGIYPSLFFKSIKILFITLGAIILIITIYKPNYLSFLNKQWIKFGFILGKFFSPIFLFIIFFLIITPTGIFLKIINKDVMGLKKKNSYWINRENKLQTMKNQF
jgi:hypothetical protein